MLKLTRFHHLPPMERLIVESKNAVKWFSNNNMIVKLDKFKPIFILKGNQTLKPEEFLIGGNVTEIVSLVKLLAILIDDQINFNLNKRISFQAT